MKFLPIFGRRVSTALLFAFITSALSAADTPKLELKDNDVWVMAGDSITAQRLHTNYIEAYYRTRYPKLRLHFRNSGIGGNRTGSVLARFDYDVAAWKPTIVSVELGMNDVGGSLESYLNGMKELIARIRAISAQPVLISSSPVDDGSIMDDWKGKRCADIHPFTEALRKLAQEENVVFVDQYHPLLALWGENRRQGAEAAGKSGADFPSAATPPPAPIVQPTPGSDGKIPPFKPTPPPLLPSLIPLGGDTVHVGPVGQFNMAATILMGWHASGEVSSATIGRDGKVAEAKGCKITEVQAQNGKLSFSRLDEAGPWPLPGKIEPALRLFPDTLKLSQFLLRVTALPEGEYRININGRAAGTRTDTDLRDGWNLANIAEGVLAERASNLYTLIGKLQSQLNNDWREASGNISRLTKALAATTAPQGTDADKLVAVFKILNIEKLVDEVKRLNPKQQTSAQELSMVLVSIKAGTKTDADKLTAAKDAMQASKTVNADKVTATQAAISEIEKHIQEMVQPISMKFEIEKQ